MTATRETHLKQMSTSAGRDHMMPHRAGPGILTQNSVRTGNLIVSAPGTRRGEFVPCSCSVTTHHHAVGAAADHGSRHLAIRVLADGGFVVVATCE